MPNKLTVIDRGSFGLRGGLCLGLVGLGLGSLWWWSIFLLLDFSLIVSDIPTIITLPNSAWMPFTPTLRRMLNWMPKALTP
jgi:hypothetical protein